MRQKLYDFLYSRGWVAAGKWKNLGNEPAGSKKKRDFKSYLDVDHPGRKLFVEVVKRHSPGSILEVGSGGMNELRMLVNDGYVQNGHRYSVADIAEKFVAEGRKEFPQVDIRIFNVNKSLPKGDTGRYDWVYCRHLIEHQPYYQKPIENMKLLAKELVIINVFRWTFGNDVINRGGYYSNSYNVFELMTFLKGQFAKVEWYLVFKGQDFGGRHQREKNPLVQRTSDHLMFFCYKSAQSPILDVKDVAAQHNIALRPMLYSEILDRCNA
jgi:hypothetical protein